MSSKYRQFVGIRNLEEWSKWRYDFTNSMRTSAMWWHFRKAGKHSKTLNSWGVVLDYTWQDKITHVCSFSIVVVILLVKNRFRGDKLSRVVRDICWLNFQILMWISLTFLQFLINISRVITKVRIRGHLRSQATQKLPINYSFHEIYLGIKRFVLEIAPRRLGNSWKCPQWLSTYRWPRYKFSYVHFWRKLFHCLNLWSISEYE